MIVAIFRPRTAADPSLSFFCHEDLTLTVNGKGRVMDTVGKEKSHFFAQGLLVDPPLLFYLRDDFPSYAHRGDYISSKDSKVKSCLIKVTIPQVLLERRYDFPFL